MMYNLVRRDLEREHFGLCRARGIALLTYSPLHSGLLARPVGRGAGFEAGTRAALNPSVYLGDEETLFGAMDAVTAAAQKAGSTPGALALGWVLRQEAVTSVIVGAQSADELRQNLAADPGAIADEVWDALDDQTRLPPSYPVDFYERQSWRWRGR
jgi:aryl-alcohol dehydrogenase-like predicted oxidoreductase